MRLQEGLRFQNFRVRELHFWALSAQPYHVVPPMPAEPAPVSCQLVRRLPKSPDLQAAPALFRDPTERMPKAQCPFHGRIPKAPSPADTDAIRPAPRQA